MDAIHLLPKLRNVTVQMQSGDVPVKSANVLAAVIALAANVIHAAAEKSNNYPAFPILPDNYLIYIPFKMSHNSLFDPKYLVHLGEDEIRVLASLTSLKKVARNETIIEAGKPVKDIFYIHKGIVRLYYTDEDGKDINTHLAWDDMFITSYYSMINEKPAMEALTAVTECTLLQFSYKGLYELYDTYPRIERLGRVLAEEAFCCLAERGLMLQTMNARERYLNFLKTAPIEIFQNIPLQDIASFLGIAPGSLSRIRNEFLHTC